VVGSPEAVVGCAGAVVGDTGRMARPPVLLVDLDGTITDSLPGIAASLHHALAEVGARWDPARDIRTIAGPPMPETLASLGLTGERLDTAMRAYRRRYDETGWLESALFDGVDELLRRLAAAGHRMAVATSKNEETARRVLEHFGLTAPFEFVGGADPAVGRSAKADVVAHSLRALGLDPGPGLAPDGPTPVLMIGDRRHDVEGAAAHGIPCCLVEWGYGSPEEWRSARWAATRPSDVEAIVDEFRP